VAPDQLPEDLFDDVEGEAREGRRELLEWLLERGISVEQLREAKREHRLALLPTERVLTRGTRWSLDEAASRSGLEREFVERVWRVAGIPIPEGDEPALDDEDLEALRVAKQALDAGLSEDAYLEISRVVGRNSAPMGEAMVEVVVEEFLDPNGSEAEVAMRLEEVAEQLTPLVPTLVSFPVRMHLRNALRHQALEQREDGAEALKGTRWMAVGFADLVGFSSLSEQTTAAEAGRIAGRLEELAGEVAEPPVRLVKLIGDEAMLVCERAHPLVLALVELRDRAEAESDFPALHVGVAAGEVVARAGDVYGPAVNRASRLVDAAGEGQLLAAPEIAQELGEGFELHELEPVELKGVGEVRPVEVRGRSRS
jgi:adenylate cyclase